MLADNEAGLYIALIRAIGPATHARMSMGALRDAARAAGFVDVSTHLATGNLVFRSALAPELARSGLRAVIAGFGLPNDVLLRRPEDFGRLLRDTPFPEAAAERPSRTIVCFLDEGAPRLDWIAAHRGPERLALCGSDALVIDYGDELAKSALAPATVEKRLGLTMTFRNWNTVSRLACVVGQLPTS